LAATAGLVAVVAGCAVDVGKPPGVERARAVDVNASGVAAVVGYVDAGGEPSAAPVASAWTIDMGEAWTPVPGLDLGVPSETVPVAINDSGTVVGTTRGLDQQAARAWVWDAAAGTRPLVADGAPAFAPRAINGAGVVAGTMGDGPQASVAALWDPATGTATALPRPEGRSTAVAEDVNDAGVVVGWTAGDRDTDVHATVWRPPAYEPELLDDSLRTYMVATDVDEDGTVVGVSRSREPEDPIGMRWAPGGPQEVLDGFVPVDIDGGTMVGRPDTYAGDDALVWPAGATAPERLGTVDGRATTVTAIRGDHLVGSVSDPEHVARFSINP
jgi:uncharacterized membrane protein